MRKKERSHRCSRLVKQLCAEQKLYRGSCSRCPSANSQINEKSIASWLFLSRCSKGIMLSGSMIAMLNRPCLLPIKVITRHMSIIPWGAPLRCSFQQVQFRIEPANTLKQKTICTGVYKFKTPIKLHYSQTPNSNQHPNYHGPRIRGGQEQLYRDSNVTT